LLIIDLRIIDLLLIRDCRLEIEERACALNHHSSINNQQRIKNQGSANLK